MNLLEINMKDVKQTKKAPTPTNSETTSISNDTYTYPVIRTKTLIIFDFDDTLICTKYLDTLNLNYQSIFSFQSSLEETNPYLIKELNELETGIISLFNELLDNQYDVIIVSNADMKWINNCLTHFLPDLKEFIQDNLINIYSAKNLFSGLTDNSSDWKKNCFMKVIKDKYKNEKNKILDENNFVTELNVVCIGDGEDEKKALFKLNSDINNSFNNNVNVNGNNSIKENNKQSFFVNKKFIQVIESPSITSILLQLKYIQDNIDRFINDNNNTLYKMMLEIKNQSIQINCSSSSSITQKNFNYYNKKNNYNNHYKKLILKSEELLDGINYKNLNNNQALFSFLKKENEKKRNNLENYNNFNEDNFFNLGDKNKNIRKNIKKYQFCLGRKRLLK